MADTRAQGEAEKWIRSVALPKKFGGRYEKRFLEVGKRADGRPATHEFDAVSLDGSIVASIKASSGRTSGGKNPSGKIKDSYAELHFLGLAKAARKLLVLTDSEFAGLFSRDSDGKLPPGVEVLHIPLPPDLQKRVDSARDAASRELSPRQR